MAQQILPFVLLGLDTDNGSEFINYALLEFCKENKITFTRSRAYKKNDQAHVEEKNGSIVRRLIGYDRYEGLNAHNALSELYATLRLYVNFFQPSLKLLSKKRDGAKVTKKYDKAKTPYQRLILSPHLSEDEKEKLTKQYDTLDPLHLFKKLEALQDNFWKHAWNPKAEEHTADPNENINQVNELINFTPSEITKAVDVVIESDSEKSTCHIVTNNNLSKDSQETNTDSPSKIRRYRNTKKPRKKLEKRTWRTRKDPFENVWDRIRLQLELNPELTAKSFLENLIKENSDEFNIKQLRTLQRQVTCWRVGQLKIQQEMYSQKTLPQDPSAEYISYITASVVI